MIERRRPDPADLREEAGPQVKQDPRRDRSVPLWASALQDVLKELAELKQRVRELEDAAAKDRAVILQLQGIAVATPPAGGTTTAGRSQDDQSQRPTLQVRAVDVTPKK